MLHFKNNIIEKSVPLNRHQRQLQRQRQVQRQGKARRKNNAKKSAKRRHRHRHRGKNRMSHNTQPHSPIGRVVRAANAARRRTLRRPSSDTFTLDALHKRLHRRDATSPTTTTAAAATAAATAATATTSAGSTSAPQSHATSPPGNQNARTSPSSSTSRSQTDSQSPAGKERQRSNNGRARYHARRPGIPTTTTVESAPHNPHQHQHQYELINARAHAHTRPPRPPPHTTGTVHASSPVLTRLPSRRRNDLRETLLHFPEHDATTVANLLTHFNGDVTLVYQRLTEARAQQRRADTTTSPLPPPPLPQLPPPPALPQSPRPRARHYLADASSRGGGSSAATARPSLSPSPSLSPRGALGVDGRPVVGVKRSRNMTREAATTLHTAHLSSGQQVDGALYGDGAMPRDRRSVSMQSSDAHVHVGAAATAALPVMTLAPAYVVPEMVYGPGGYDKGSEEQAMALGVTQRGRGEEQEMGSDDKRVVGLLRRVQDLERRLREHEKHSRKLQDAHHKRTEGHERDMTAVKQTHDSLMHDLDDNQRRVMKTEQYLDSMRCEMVLAVGRRRWKFISIAKAGLNNGLYYLLAYLVPVLAFVVRLLRDVVVQVRSRRRVQQARIRRRDDGASR